MFHPILLKKYPYIANYFTELFRQDIKKLPNALLFYGLDILGQYIFARNIAKILNCKKDKEYNCDCLNCNWINTNTHPDILTVSKIDLKAGNDNTKTVISVKQTEMIKEKLSIPSENYRVIIFCDADIKNLTPVELELYMEYKNTGFNFENQFNQNVSKDESKKWYPSGITQKVLQEEASNALLKLVEEPPNNVLFIFLAKDKQDVIETILSRCNIFYFPQKVKENYNLEIGKEFFQDYSEFKKLDFNSIYERLLIIKEKYSIELDFIFDNLEQYLLNLLKTYYTNKYLFQTILRDINYIQESKKQLNSYLKEVQIFENLSYNLSCYSR